VRTIPIDSTDAREQRELEAALAAEATEAATLHAATCVDGWLGEDLEGHPIACPTCRPHLLTSSCTTCGIDARACRLRRDIGRPPCCDRCSHNTARSAA
jgi:hypothetical protein